ncbi:MAG TPA: hypothetical protein VM869_28140 [Enhygromyxa sp.]|nr:hypothetical protein [Enhygromyxa sp.]
MDPVQTVQTINTLVTGSPGAPGDGNAGDGKDTEVPWQQASDLAIQSIAQSTALSISDAADMLRNIETIMTTAMGVAMAKWIETPENIFYQQIVEAAGKAIESAAGNYKTIGTDAQAVLELFDPTG